MLTEAQIEQRRSYVTGSDAAIILGLNPYESIISLWQHKLGIKPPKDLSDNPRVRAGNYLEPVVCKMFEDIVGKTVEHPEGLRVHKEHPWMGATLDGRVKGENAIVEFKTAGFPDAWGDQGQAVIPKQYLCQVAHYMAVEDADYAYVAVLISGWDFRYYVIDRNKNLEEIIIAKEHEFYIKNMVEKEEPEPRNLDDVVDLYRYKSIPDPVKAHPGIIAEVANMNCAKVAIKKHTEDSRIAKEKIALYMREHRTLMDGTGKDILATFNYNKDGQQFNMTKFKKEHPDIHAQYLEKKEGARVLRLKGQTDDE